MFGFVVGTVFYVVVCLLTVLFYVRGKSYFSRYRELMENVRDGWTAMAISTFLIYVLMIVSATYPVALKDRPEYLAVYGLLCLTIVSFYAVFVLSLLQRKKLYDVNIQLLKEQEWHKIAYIDAITELPNRMAYMEHINNIERTASDDCVIYAIMMDIDNFKRINDTLGHYVGDETLKTTAGILTNIFSDDGYSVFRIGGDEFAIVAIDIPEREVQQKLNYIRNIDCGREGCTFSLGCSLVNIQQNNAMENAFIRADALMYEEKRAKKLAERV